MPDIGPLCDNIKQAGGGMVVLFLPNLNPKLGYYVAWMNRIPVYWLCSRIVIPSPCINKHVECLATHPWRVVLQLSNKIMDPEDGWVVLQLSPNLFPQIGCSEAWLNRIPVYWSHTMLVRYCACTQKHANWVETYPWPFVFHVTTYSNLMMASLFWSSLHQICSHITRLGALGLGWTEFLYIDCVSGLLDLSMYL